MKKKLLGPLLFLFCFIITPAQTVFENYLDGRVYVKLTKAVLKPLSKENPDNLPVAKLTPVARLIGKYGITKANLPFWHANEDAYLPYVVKLEFSKISEVNSLLEDLEQIPGVEYAEKVSLMKLAATTPNDFAISSASIHLAQIGAQNAWDYFNGNSNITVAIIDNAVMWSHADLVANTYTNMLEANGIPGVDDDGNTFIDDINGYNVADLNNNAEPVNPNIHFHGTLCAGVAGARTDNGIGVSSIGWNLKIIPVQCEPDNSSSITNVLAGYEGIIYAVKAKARIISCSWGNHIAPSPIEQAVIDYAWKRGSIIIASAGNIGTNSLIYPGSYNHVYCVSAVNPADVKWGQSCYGNWVDISAPGENIYTTMAYSGSPAYGNFSGTSLAAPMVAGLAGLILSKSPAMTQTAVLNCISSTAANIYTLSGNSAYASGSQLGAGRIDAFAAMACAASFSVAPPVANFYACLPNTCPNTLIPFIDSSLYLPTSWSWTFQGGTPATSTSSNPSVQWSTPGTYSVSLTVTNTHGSSTKTKLSYITVAGPSPLPFSEGFQSTSFLPPGWVANNIWNDVNYWERVTGVGGYGTSTACAMFNNYDYNVPGERDEMRSPKFDLSNVVKTQLHFDVAYARVNAFLWDSLAVKISTNCGTTWTIIYLNGGSGLATAPDQGLPFVPSSTDWKTEHIDISPFASGQGNVMFSFENRGNFGQNIYIDNVNLSFPTPTLNTMNVSSVCITPTYTFSNISQAAAGYTWNFQGGTPASSTASNPAVSYASAGTYTYSIFGVNGTSTASITKTITVVPEPTISASSASYCSGITYTLNANAPGVTSYIWSDAGGVISNNSVLVFMPLASTFFTLVGSNAVCSAEGVYTINVVPSPTLTVNNPSACAGSPATLTASGATTYSWSTSSTGSSITVNPASSTLYTVTGTTGMCSAEATVNLLVFQLPVAAISPSNASCSNCPDGSLEATIISGPAPYTYTWMPSGGNSALAQGLIPGCYTVTVADVTGCRTETTSCVSFFTGISGHAAASSLLIYPNPAKNSVTIAFKNVQFKYTVYNNLGQVVLDKKDNKDTSVIDLSPFAKGTYLVEVESQGVTIRKKLLVE